MSKPTALDLEYIKELIDQLLDDDRDFPGPYKLVMALRELQRLRIRELEAPAPEAPQSKPTNPIHDPSDMLSKVEKPIHETLQSKPVTPPPAQAPREAQPMIDAQTMEDLILVTEHFCEGRVKKSLRKVRDVLNGEAVKSPSHLMGKGEGPKCQ